MSIETIVNKGLAVKEEEEDVFAFYWRKNGWNTENVVFFFTNPMPKHKIKSLTCQKLQAMREQYFLTELGRKHQI